MKLYDLIDEMALLVNNTTEDMLTMGNILLFINNQNDGVVPDELLGRHDLANQVPVNTLDVLIRKSLEDAEVQVTDELFDSMIDGEVYEYYASKYVELYFLANKNLIQKFTERWDDVKEFVQVKFIDQEDGES